VITDKPNGPDPDNLPAVFYVSVINGKQRALLAGPYGTHAQALAKVLEVTDLALAVDSHAWFYRYGTAGGPDGLKTVFGLV
jgi:hypothetical protein